LRDKTTELCNIILVYSARVRRRSTDVIGPALRPLIKGTSMINQNYHIIHRHNRKIDTVDDGVDEHISWISEASAMEQRVGEDWDQSRTILVVGLKMC